MQTISYDMIRRLTGAELLGPAEGTVDKVLTDSRKAAEGGLFVALKGENFDGNDFAEKALLSGCQAALCSKRPDPIPEGKTVFLVPDSLKAYGSLARGYKRQLQTGKYIPVVGVTGSVGKTSCKDMIAAALSGKFHTLKTQGNLNNIFGVPMTLLTMDDTTQAAVIEMGMGHAGEIDFMASLAQPDIGVITNVGTAHIENLGSREGILKAKLEIVPHIKEDGLLLACGDDERLYAQKGRLPRKTEYFGFGAQNDCRILLSEQQSRGLHVVISYRGQTFDMTLATIGQHMALNAAPAVMAAVNLGLSKEQILKGMASYQPTPHRLALIPGDKWTVIDDTYNANPVSMKSALTTLSQMAGGRRIAILGDMFELGDYSQQGHEEVGAFAMSLASVDGLICVGERSQAMYQAALPLAKGRPVLYFKTVDDLEENLLSILKPDDIILLKASHAMGFTPLCRWLQKEV